MRLGSKTTYGLLTAAIWQLSNYAIPLATFPYLARVLGLHGFGLLGLVTAATNYALILTDWGFYLTATQAIARSQTQAAINRVIWSTVCAKCLLGFISSAVLIAIALLADLDGSAKNAILLSQLNIVASVVNLDWVLRGSERLGSFAAASIIGRVISIPLIYLLVRQPNDLASAVFSGAFGSIISASLTIWLCCRFGLLRTPIVTRRDIMMQIRVGAHVFFSTAAVSLYTNFLNLFVGFTSGPIQVGLFSGSDKIRRPVQSLLSPIEIVFYPRLSSLASNDPERAILLSLRVLRIQTLASLCLTALLFLLAPLLVHILLGPQFSSAIPVLRIMSILVALIGANNVLGLMIMLPFGFKKEFTLCTAAGAVVGLATVIPLAVSYGAVGAALAAVAAELCVVAAMYWTLVRCTTWFRLLTDTY